jgi:membrane protease subunit HflC
VSLPSRRVWIASGLLAVAALLVGRSLVVVDETEYVLLTDFGRPVAVLGDAPGEAGLHWRRPWQTAIRVDRRVQVADPPAREVITADKKNLEVAGVLVWRVADPLRFLRAAGTLEAAASRLEERAAASLAAAVGARTLDAMATTDAARFGLDALTAEVRREVAAGAAAELGVDLIDVQLRRFGHPLEVRPAVFDLIRSERQQVAATLRAEGEAAYVGLTSAADRERDEALARADAEAARIRGNAEAEATRTLNAAQARDPAFADFLRALDAYKSIVDGQSTIVLSTGSPLLKLLTEGPPPELLRPPATGPAGTPEPVAGAAVEPWP